MKKLAFGACATLVICHGAQAQSSVTLYGLIDTGLVFTTNQKGGHEYQELSGVTQGSRWGLLGKEDLGGGTQAIFDLENGFATNTGALGQGGLEFGRQAYVGLSNKTYGTLTLGRQYEEMVDYISTATTDKWSVLFEHPGDNDSTNRGFRVNNAIKYASADFNGAKFSALYALGGNPGAFAQNGVYSLGASYAHGPFYLATAYTHVDHPGQINAGTFWTATNSADGNYALTATSYDVVGASAKLTMGQAEVDAAITQSRFEHSVAGGNVRFQNYDLNASYRFTPALMVGTAFVYTNGLVETQGGHPRYQQASLFIDYNLSTRSDVYLMGTTQWANGTAAVAQVSQFLSASTSNRQTSVAVGMRHRF